MDRSLFSTHFGVCLSVCLRWSRSRTCRGQMKKTGGGKTSWFVLMISLKEQKIKKIRSDAARESGRNIDKIHRAGEECGTFSYCDNLSHQLSLQLKLGRPPPSPVQFCQEGASWRDGWKRQTRQHHPRLHGAALHVIGSLQHHLKENRERSKWNEHLFTSDTDGVFKPGEWWTWDSEERAKCKDCLETGCWARQGGTCKVASQQQPFAQPLILLNCSSLPFNIQRRETLSLN